MASGETESSGPVTSSKPDRGASESIANPIQRVLIIGAGWTGRQIAGQMAAFGVDVLLIDPQSRALRDSVEWVESNRVEFADRGYWPIANRVSLLGKIELGESIEAVHQPIDLVLESVSEQFSLKRKILKGVSRKFASPTVIASNSSYFTPSMMQPHVEEPERFANFHFHVPIWRATLVDVATGSQTSEQTLNRLIDLANRIGQTPLAQRVENPGYVFNWMLKALLQSALQLVERGVAQPADIDMAWKKVTGMPLGPFGIMDQIGVDLIHQTMSHARFVDGDEVWQPLVDILQPYVDSNRLGMKTGQGFFEY